MHVMLNGNPISVKGKVQERQVNPWVPRVTEGVKDFGNFSACETKVYGDWRGGLGIKKESTDSNRFYYSFAETSIEKALLPAVEVIADSLWKINADPYLVTDFESKIYVFGNSLSLYDTGTDYDHADCTPLSSPTDVITIKDATDNYLIYCNGADVRYASSGYDASSTQLYAGQLTWTRSADAIDVVCTADTTVKVVGTQSAKMACTATLGVENIAYYDTGTLDISGKKYILCFMYSSVALDAGDLHFVLATDTALGGTTETYDVPAMVADQWYRHCITITTPASFASLDSIGIAQAVDKGAMNIYVDEVRAVVNTNWAALSTSDISYMCSFDNRLCGVNSTGTTLFSSAQNNIDDCAGGVMTNSFSMTGQWNTVYDLFTGLMPQSSTQVIFMLTDVGLVSIDYFTQTSDLMDVLLPKPPSGVPMIGMYYNGEILISYGSGIKKISANGIVTEWGHNQDDALIGLYYDTKYIWNMKFTNNFVLISLKGTDTGNCYIAKRHNTVGGWHFTNTSITAYGRYFHYYNDNLYIVGEFGAAVDYIYYSPFKDTQSELLGAELKYQTTTNHYTSWFAPVEVISKIALQVEAITSDCDADYYITVYYKLNDFRPYGAIWAEPPYEWTTLGTFTTSPYPPALTFGSGAGVNFYNIAFKIKITHYGNTTAAKPILRQMIFKYTIIPSYIGTWTFELETDGIETKEVYDQLVAARDATTLVSFYPTGNAADTGYFVKVNQMPSLYDCVYPSPDRKLTVVVSEVV